MNLQVDCDRLNTAYHTARARLLAERNSANHWTGELSSSPLSTATAISALILAEQESTCTGLPAYNPGEEPSHVDEIFQGDLSEMIVHSMHWLAEQQNEDGGWGDTDKSLSNIATTMLVQAAFHLTGVPAKYTDLLMRAEKYVEDQGGISALKDRYEGDKTFAVPILTNCALADMVPWRSVPALPFELACVPQEYFHRLNLPVVSYAIPALVAVGQAKFHHSPPLNPITRWIRSSSAKKSLEVLEKMQPASGGFLEATPLTSFVVMCLASMGLKEHPVVRRGVEFLLASVRADGSWPIDSNLATWNTSQALLAIESSISEDPEDFQTAYNWLLECQHLEQHSFTGAEPGGWAWTDLSGGVPDADDTSAALLALATWYPNCNNNQRQRVTQAARNGINWLLNLQNNDGGWPTFCRGWGRLPFDRSSTDISAHALRAISGWKKLLRLDKSNSQFSTRINSAITAGLNFIRKQQHPEGYWNPLWFGNQHHPQESNPVYGTAKVLIMCHELDICEGDMPLRAAQWLANVQFASGGWGVAGCPVEKDEVIPSIEETALAVEALLPYRDHSEKIACSLNQGLHLLVELVEQDRWVEPTPIGFYFAKLWYYERLYPQIFTTRALCCARQALSVVPSAVETAC